jgi:hypothetical protein
MTQPGDKYYIDPEDEEGSTKHKEFLLEWRGSIPVFNKESEQTIDNALYAFSERGLFEMENVGFDAAMEIYAVIAKCLKDGFPEQLRM